MSFPLASETPPTLTPYQWQFNGYKFGSGGPFRLKKVDGLELPTIRTGDSGRPRDRGSFMGLDVPGEREVTVQGDIGTDGVSFGHALQEFRRGLVPQRSLVAPEKPLYVNYPAIGTIVAMARVRKRALPVDIVFTLGNLAQGVAVLFAMTDPCFYGATATTVITATVPSHTLAFPMSFPLSFGGGSYAASAVVTNTGEEETRPRILIEGPCARPAVWNSSLEGEPTLAFNLNIPAGGKLELDTDMHTALYFAPGATSGEPVSTLIVPGSEWWTLPPGASTVNFTPGSGEAAGQVTLEYAPAYLL